MRNINQNLVIALAWMLATASMLFSCSDDTDSLSVDEQKLQIVPYGKMFTEEAGTRALPAGYEDFMTANPTNTKSIAIYLADESNHCADPAYFTPTTGNTWASTVKTELNTQYYVYGYFPADCTSSPALTSTDYAQGVTLTLPGLSTFSADDVCVTVGVETLGNYGFKMSSVTDNKINCLLLDHIFSALLFEFKLDAGYADLRQVQLTNVILQQTTGYEKVTATVNIVPDASAPKSITWTNEGTEASFESCNLVTATDGVYLTSAGFTSLREIYTPVVSTLSFNLVTTYNVYDKKGNLVRENCHATNKISLANPSTTAGERTRIQLLVQPTYLYQLSDPDLDNPTIKEI